MIKIMDSKVFLGVLFVAGAVGAQDAPRNAPKTPPQEKRDPATRVAVESRDQGAGSEVVILPELAGLVIVGSEAEIAASGVRGIKGMEVKSPDFLKTAKGLAGAMAKYFGRPLSEAGLRSLQRDLVIVCRENDRPVVDVIFPEQEILDNTIQVIVLQAKIGQIRVRNDGKQYYSEEWIRERAGLTADEPVRGSAFLSNLNRLNRSPYFREVNVAFSQGDLGMTDVDLVVKDRFPLRGYVGYENTGTKIIDENRWVAGFNYGNLFSRDHQLNYQFAGNTDLQRFRSHAASYVAPLPWEHVVYVYGGYTELEADFSKINAALPLTSQGESWQVGMRYSVPLPRMRGYDHEVSVGFDFKSLDTAAEFTNIPLGNTPADIGIVGLSYRGILRDKLGRTEFRVSGYYGPGGIGEDNTTPRFSAIRSGADSEFFYSRVELERLTKLFYGFTWSSRAFAQFTDSNLIPSEQIGAGGYATVRGYSERIVAADQGFVFSNELRFPLWKLGNMLQIDGGVDTLQFLAFIDYATIRQKFVQPADDPHSDLLSAGVGLRYKISTHLDLRFDYGFQFTERQLSRNIGEKSSRGHVGVVVSF